MSQEGASVAGENLFAPAEATISGVSLDRLVNRLFEASLAVAAGRALVDTRVAGKLDSVTEMLDSMIRDLREAVFETCDALSPIQARRAIADPPPLFSGEGRRACDSPLGRSPCSGSNHDARISHRRRQD